MLFGAESPKKAFWTKKITSSSAGPEPPCLCVRSVTFPVQGTSQCFGSQR